MTGTKSASFNWQPPPEEDHNGPILYYTLRIVEEEFNQREIVVNTTNTNYEIFTLEEYIRYLCQVSAATESGNGPYSSPLMFTTLQDGLLRIIKFTALLIWLYTLQFPRHHLSHLLGQLRVPHLSFSCGSLHLHMKEMD